MNKTKQITVKLPESINDITLRQWQEISVQDSSKLGSTDFYIRKVLSIAYGISLDQYDLIHQRDVDEMANALFTCIKQKPKFKNRFHLNGKEYGFIPNFDLMTFGEFIDLDSYTEPKDYHKLMSILFRPISRRQGGRYDIEQYKGSNDDLLEMPVGICLGAVAFFLSIGTDLTKDTLNCLSPQEKAQLKGLIMPKSGDGLFQSTHYAKEIS